MESRIMQIKKIVRLHKIQHNFRMSRALYRGFVGGRGSGKSWVGAYDLIRRATRNRTYLVASPTGVLMGDTTFPTFKAIAQDLGVWGDAKMTPYPTVELTTGATVRFRTAEDPERMRGPNLSGIWLDEASLMHEDAYKIAIACLRECGEQGWLSATFTPKGLTHWTHEQFGKEKQDTALFHCHTRDNPFLPKDFAKTLMGQYVGQFAAQELGGLFVQMEGAEWPAEYFDGIFFDEWPRDVNEYTRVMALDPSKGKTDASGDYSAWIMLGVDRDLCLWVDADLDNTRPVESPINDAEARSIVSDGFRLFRQFGPQAVLVEINGFQEMVATALARHARERGIVMPIYTINHTTPKAQRIRGLGPFLAQRRLRVRNTHGGRLLVQQLRDFSPTVEHDDGPDALETAVAMANKLIYSDGGYKIEAAQA